MGGTRVGGGIEHLLIRQVIQLDWVYSSSSSSGITVNSRKRGRKCRNYFQHLNFPQHNFWPYSPSLPSLSLLQFASFIPSIPLLLPLRPRLHHSPPPTSRFHDSDKSIRS